MNKWILAMVLAPLATSGYAITLGEDATEPAHNVSIRSSNMAEFPMCMGSLIDSQWVLTAAHCVVMPGENEEDEAQYTVTLPGNLAVTFGAIDLTVTPATQESEYPDIINIINVSHVVVHPDYRRIHVVESKLIGEELTEELINTNLSNDIALLRLRHPLTTIAPVKIPTLEKMEEIESSLIEDWNNYAVGQTRPENIQIAGWGSKNEQDPFDKLVSITLQETSQMYLPVSECFDRLEAGKELPEFVATPVDVTKFCTQPTKWKEYLFEDPEDPEKEPIYEGQYVGNSACLGDGGGALLANDSVDAEYQIGVVSGAPLILPVCGSVTIPNFHTKVAPYYDWIQSYLELDEAPDNVVIPPEFIDNAKQNLPLPEDEVDILPPSEDDKLPVDELPIEDACNENSTVFKDCDDSSSGGLGYIPLMLLGGLLGRRKFLSRD